MVRARVPFDNVRKMIALRSAGHTPLPGGDAVEFFENWLEHGTGAPAGRRAMRCMYCWRRSDSRLGALPDQCAIWGRSLMAA
jgi:hypothetical protein